MKIWSILLLFNKWQSLFLFNPRSVFTIVETMTRAAISSSKRKRSFYAQLKTWRNYKLPLRHFLASSSLGRYTLWWKRWACFHVVWSARCCIAETLSFFLHVLIDCVSLYLMKRSRIFLFTPLGRLFRFSARCVSSASTLQMPVRLEVWIAVWRSFITDDGQLLKTYCTTKPAVIRVFSSWASAVVVPYFEPLQDPSHQVSFLRSECSASWLVVGIRNYCMCKSICI